MPDKIYDTIVLGLGPGSGLDLFARVMVDALQTKLGTNFVIDYRVGAAGNIGYALLFRLASGDCYGKDQPIILQLLEIPTGMKALDLLAETVDD